jgi:hypothetical protein
MIAKELVKQLLPKRAASTLKSTVSFRGYTRSLRRQVLDPGVVLHTYALAFL